MKRDISDAGVGPVRIVSCAVLVGLCGLVAVAPGCSRYHEDKFSRARPPVFKASGRVTWNGSPAAGALVTLQSRSHKVAASGKADQDGVFTLTTWRPSDGAIAGEHAVTIETVVITGTTPDGNVIEVNDMPPKYRDPEKSGLTATITAKGKNVLSFDVVGPPQIAKKAARE